MAVVSSIRLAPRRSWSLVLCLVTLWTPIFLLQLQCTTAQDEDSNCEDEKTLYANCVFRMEPPSQGKACDECRRQAYRELPVDFQAAVTLDDDSPTTCTDIETDVCLALHSCSDCGECKDELEDFWRCSTETETSRTCTIDCLTESSPTSAGPLCPAQFDSYKTCVLDELPEAQGSACDTCRLQASNRIPSDVDDCTVVQDIFCQALQTCDCGSCRSNLQDYLDCDVNKRWFGECNVNCAGYNINNEGDGNSITQSLSGGVTTRYTNSFGMIAMTLGLMLVSACFLV